VQRPHIGRRWTPGHRIYFDRDSGLFEEVNGPGCHLSGDDLAIQTALLHERRPRRLTQRLGDAVFAVALGIVGAVLAVHFLAR
jgi:hypothetical protein